MTVQIRGHPHASLLEIEPRGPFRLDLTAWALRRRPHNAIDRWDASTYRRVVCADGGPVALSVTCGPRAFPGPEDLATLEPDELRRHGFS
jgi:hypothetical protein